MFRILLVITLILLAIPLFNKVSNYSKQKAHDVKESAAEIGSKAKNVKDAVVEAAKEVPQKIDQKNGANNSGTNK